MEITIENINKYGFVFHEYNHEKILKDNDEDSLDSLEEYIQSLIKIPNENLYGDIDIVEPGGYIDLHYHIVPGSFQVVIWAPESDFEGRYYLYGTSEEVKQIKPRKGLMCFMKPNDPHFIHGVSKLLSDTPIKSYGFSSSVFPLPEVNDIYINL